MAKTSILDQLRKLDKSSKLATLKIECNGMLRLFPESALNQINESIDQLRVTIYKIENEVAEVVESFLLDNFTSEMLSKLKEELDSNLRITISGKATEEQLKGIAFNAEMPIKKQTKSVSTSEDIDF